jgi:hypothetical protein
MTEWKRRNLGTLRVLMKWSSNSSRGRGVGWQAGPLYRTAIARLITERHSIARAIYLFRK